MESSRPRKTPKMEPPTENPDSTKCSYYVARKHRFCRTENKAGHSFCVTHIGSSCDTSTAAASPEEGPRVPCPINGNHTVFASRLERHIKVCPDLRFITAGLPYYSGDLHANKGAMAYCASGCNDDAASCGASRPEQSTRLTHRDLSPEHLAELTSRVQRVYNSCIVKDIVPLESLVGSAVSADDDSDGLGDGEEAKSQKHGPQHRALLRCLNYALEQQQQQQQQQKHKLHGSCSLDGFLELGAGKGGLSLALQKLLVAYTQSTPGTPQQSTLLAKLPLLAKVRQSPPAVLAVVDFDSFKRKADSRASYSPFPLRRIRIDLKDLNLTKAAQLEPLRTCEESMESASIAAWAVTGKHLCGACTDFALSCITEPHLEEEGHLCVTALVLATCCHQRCELRHLNPVGVAVPAAATAEKAHTRASPQQLQLPGTDVTFTAEEFAALTSMSSWAVCGAAVDEAKREIGYQCKRLIDALRVAYLRESGYTVRMCTYAPREVTGENVCIVAWK